MSKQNIQPASGIFTPQPKQPIPQGMKVKTFEHSSFSAIEHDVETWSNQPQIRQLTSINTYSVQALGVVRWYTVIYYIWFL